MQSQPPLYRQIADHYLHAIRSGVLAPGDRMPSVRRLTRLHRVSVSTTLQACRHLEDAGWLEARPRSGYFVRRPQRVSMPRVSEPDGATALVPHPYAGIHDRVSDFVAKCEQHPVTSNFAIAFGAPALYPAAALKAAAIRALRRRPELLVGQVPVQGDASFRAVLARRALAHGMAPTPDDIVVTHGCIEALNLALRTVAQAGDLVAVESPTYFGLLQILESLGLRALEIPTSPRTGLSVDALELALRTHPSIKAVVAVPDFQNPLGCVMPDDEKARLVALCEAHGVPLIEDDTYGALTEDGRPLRTLKSWDRTGNVLYCASLHKTLAPGMRLGWMIGGRWLARVKMLKHAQSRFNDALSQTAVADFMGSAAYDRHLGQLCRRLKAQRERIAESIAACFPAGTRLTVPDGGMLLWLELPERRSAQAVFEAGLRDGIRVAPGNLFTNSSRFDHYLRISCGLPVSPAAERALERLGRIVAQAPGLDRGAD